MKHASRRLWSWLISDVGRMKMKAALVSFLLAVTACLGADLPTDLEVARIDHDLPPLQKASREEFTFRIYVRPALSFRQYAVDGKIRNPETIDVSGSVSLVEKTKDDISVRIFNLTPSQVHEVLAWFSEAKFGPMTKETLDIPVLDGVDILVEGYRGGRYFRLRRNSGDSPASVAFMKRVEAFRIWKETPNKSPEPTPTAVTPRAR